LPRLGKRAGFLFFYEKEKNVGGGVEGAYGSTRYKVWKGRKTKEGATGEKAGVGKRVTFIENGSFARHERYDERGTGSQDQIET